jgi:LAO/AO transport system kinase
MSDGIRDLIRQAEGGDIPALARLLTHLERTGPSVLSAFPQLLKPQQQAFRIGITGPPGAGKSTLISQLIKRLREEGQRVAVLAVDPSSPFSKGAVLGDRIRYSEHFGDAGVFIRSIGSRGSLGGLSSGAYLMVRAFDVSRFDTVLIETVGVGQTELEIMNVADFVSVVLVPESGDAIQGMKAGLLEIADLFVVNKADRPGADIFARELEASLNLVATKEDEHAKIHSVSAARGDGISELIRIFLEAKAGGEWQKTRVSPERIRSEARALLRDEYEREIDKRITSISTPDQLSSLFTK